MANKKELAEETVLETLCNDKLFYAQAWAYAVSQRKKQRLELDYSPIENIIEEEYAQLSRRFDLSVLQESCAVRNVLRTRKLAEMLVDEKGEILLDLFPSTIEHLRTHVYSLGPERQYDGVRQRQILNVLEMLLGDKEMQGMLKKVHKPIGNRNLEAIICDTLAIPPTTALTDGITRRAVLSAWMCYLRQNVGSCFATAPAILAHDEDPKIFLQDIIDLIASGRITRTFAGIEYSAPLSTSWGAGDLKKQFILTTELKEDAPIWTSPAIIAAFDAVGLLSEELDKAGKSNALKKIVLDLVSKWPSPYSFVIASVEEILKKALLRSYDLRDADLTDYLNRPRSMIQNNLLLYVPQIGSKKFSKSEACEHYLTSIELAKNVFKQYADNALLKAWEFTVASFAETRPTFSAWNFHASLGLNTNEEGGIGERLYELCKERLDYYNAEANEHNEEYERLYDQIKYLETRLRTASTEQEGKWIKVELQSRMNEFNSLQELRDRARNKAQGFANLYNILHETYTDLFPQYFQEIYDADLHEVAAGPYDDSPAGFRLIYKHGRSNASQWTAVTNAQEFIDSLVSFFIATEREIVDSPYLRPVKDELGAIITALVMHLKTDKFLETSFWRMARQHNAPLIKDPLKNIEQVEKKPWVYTSGGSMSSLMSSYFRLVNNPSSTSRWVENTSELLVFLVDTIKHLPPKWQQLFRKDPRLSLLIHSPTHAFVLKPGLSAFREAWEMDAYTYTSVRDNLVIPTQQFINGILLDSDKMGHLINLLANNIPTEYKERFKELFWRMDGLKHSYEFRDYVLQMLEGADIGRSASKNIITGDEIDAFLYTHLPLQRGEAVRSKLLELFASLSGLSGQSMKNIEQIVAERFTNACDNRILTAKELQDVIKGILCVALKTTSTAIDYHYEVISAARRMDWALPAPIVFADTNWVKDYFSFVVNPGTLKLELWRTDYLGSVGAPMSMWHHWLDGSHKTPTWGVYHKPQEYIFM